MEPKKNPNADINRYRGQLFLLGLSISLSLLIIAFEWKVQQIKIDLPPESQPDVYHFDAVPYRFKEESAEPKPVKKRIQVASLENISEIKNNELPSELMAPKEVAAPIEVVVKIEQPVIPEEPKDTTFITVEKRPEPIGGYQSFYKLLQKHIKYPATERRTNTEGSVYVKFVVNEFGEVTRLSILKGIGNGCDEEALRVIALTKWEPGKQRGKPVKVQMIQPVFFALN